MIHPYLKLKALVKWVNQRNIYSIYIIYSWTSSVKNFGITNGTTDSFNNRFLYLRMKKFWWNLEKPLLLPSWELTYSLFPKEGYVIFPWRVSILLKGLVVALHVGDKFLDAFIIFLQLTFFHDMARDKGAVTIFLEFVVVKGDGWLEVPWDSSPFFSPPFGRIQVLGIATLGMLGPGKQVGPAMGGGSIFFESQHIFSCCWFFVLLAGLWWASHLQELENMIWY